MVLNEKEYVETMLDTGEVGKSPTSSLYMLAKYCRQVKQLSVKDTYKTLHEFMADNYAKYVPALWEDVIEKISKNADKYQLREIDAVQITKTEMEKVLSFPKEAHQRVIFVLLCYAKMGNLINGNNDGWTNLTINKIFSEAGVKTHGRKDKLLILSDMVDNNLLSLSKRNDNTHVKVEFCDNGEPALYISDFRRLDLQLMSYKGKGRYCNCRECGIIVPKKTNNQIYCAECAKRVNVEKSTADKMRRYVHVRKKEEKHEG